MIADIVPCSFIDYPGRLAAVLFTQGCNLRCRYCHNPGLCPPKGTSTVSRDKILSFLEGRRGKLNGVVVSGGEPTLHEDLCSLLGELRSLGLAVKIDTNGTCPERIETWIAKGLVDYAAVDVKTAPGVSSQWLCGVERQAERAIKTLRCLVEARVPCEARTTVVRGLHDARHLERLARSLANAGIAVWRAQPVSPARVLDKTVSLFPPKPEVLADAVEAAISLGLDAAVRAAP